MKTPRKIIRRLLSPMIMLVCVSAQAGIGVADREPLRLLCMEDGLSGVSVSKIITDHNGKVWISATGGVDVFNGKDLYSYDISVCGRKRNTVGDICEGADGTIYAVTRDGIIQLSAGSDEFRHILPEIPNPQCLFADGDRLYIGCRDGLFVYDGERAEPIAFSTSHVKLDNSVRLITRASDGSIYFFSRYAIHHLAAGTDSVETIHINRYLPPKAAYGQFAVEGQKIYVGTKNHGLFCYDQLTNQVTHLDAVGNIITSVYNCHDGYICVGTDGAGAFLVDTRTDSVAEHFGMREEGRHQTPTNAVYYYRRDENGVDWLGFSRYGAAYSYHSAQIFSTFASDNFTTKGVDVRSFCFHDSEAIIGTFRGMTYVDRQRGMVRHFAPEDMLGAHIVTRIVWHQGRYYVGTYDGGLLVLDPRTLTVGRQNFDSSLSTSNISAMAVSAAGDLWIGCSDGLFLVDSSGAVRHFTEQNSHIAGGSVLSITFDERGNVWITATDGLSALVPSVDGWVCAAYPDGFFNQLRRLKGTAGHDGRLLFYADDEVLYTNAAMTDFGTLPLLDGLPDEVCTALTDDGSGRYWVSTHHGLFMREYGSNLLMHFGYGEGLRGSLVNCMGTDSEGVMWIGTSDGLVSVSQDAIERWKADTRYHVLLTHILQDGKMIGAARESLVNEKNEMSLSWNFVGSTLSFKPLLADYAKPYARVYEYRLDDDAQWTVVAGEAAVSIGRLSLGNHQLSVRLAGAQGTEEVIILKVRPSLWFNLEALAIIVAVILWFARKRERRDTRDLLHERDQMEEAIIEMEEQYSELTDKTDAAETTEKYQKARLTDEECQIILQRLRKYLETEHAYRNPDLKRDDIAAAIGTSIAKLSQLFSQQLGETYYEFINRYRMEEFKSLIEQGEYKRFTITSLSERCGFKKTSFFSTFRKVEGMTPTEYLKSKNIKVKF